MKVKNLNSQLNKNIKMYKKTLKESTRENNTDINRSY